MLFVFLFVLVLVVLLVSWVGEVCFDGVLFNGVFYVCNVESMQEGCYCNMVCQYIDYSCGVVVFVIVFCYVYYFNVDEMMVIQGMMGVVDEVVVKQCGFLLLDIKYYVELFGMCGCGYCINEVCLCMFCVFGLVLMDVCGFCYFVVFKQVCGNIVELVDFMFGN